MTADSSELCKLAAFVDGSAPEGLYIAPIAARGHARPPAEFLPIGNGSACFSHLELILRDSQGLGQSTVCAASTLIRGLGGFTPAFRDHLTGFLRNFSQPRPVWAGFDLARPLVMGIVNTTPDSFSDGGLFLRHDKAIEQGQTLAAAGADIIDIGGESSRPGATPVDVATELERVVPVVAALAQSKIIVSIDTRHAAVMRAALDAGASIVNDISALADPAAVKLIRERCAPVILMHMQGEPATMQRAPAYRDVSLDVFDFLKRRVNDLEELGLQRNQIILDPGIGFGKTLQHNVALLRRLELFLGIGCGLLIGVSRKGFISQLAQDNSNASERLAGSLAIAVEAVARGVNIVRVHDVAATVQALRVGEAIKRV